MFPHGDNVAALDTLEARHALLVWFANNGTRTISSAFQGPARRRRAAPEARARAQREARVAPGRQPLPLRPALQLRPLLPQSLPLPQNQPPRRHPLLQAPKFPLLAQFPSLAKPKGIYIGSAFDNNRVSDTTYSNIVLSNVNQITCENSMKWESIEATQGVFSSYSADEMIKLAQLNSLTMRGHTLVWHSQLPSYVQVQCVIFNPPESNLF
ncbi:hypothetical protein FRC14_006194 [Serendipita sp. 396]|nr:hypothetical protein FRC14_006194 [Serendipita sp. 396]